MPIDSRLFQGARPCASECIDYSHAEVSSPERKKSRWQVSKLVEAQTGWGSASDGAARINETHEAAYVHSRTAGRNACPASVDQSLCQVPGLCTGRPRGPRSSQGATQEPEDRSARRTLRIREQTMTMIRAPPPAWPSLPQPRRKLDANTPVDT